VTGDDVPEVSLKPDFAKVEERFEAWWRNSSPGDRPIVTAREILRDVSSIDDVEHMLERLEEVSREF